MGHPTPRTETWVKNGPITMEFDETGKKFVQIYGSWSIFGVPRPPGAIPGRNGEKQISISPPGSEPMYATVYPVEGHISDHV